MRLLSAQTVGSSPRPPRGGGALADAAFAVEPDTRRLHHVAQEVPLLEHRDGYRGRHRRPHTHHTVRAGRRSTTCPASGPTGFIDAVHANGGQAGYDTCERWQQVQAAHTAIGPMFWGDRTALSDACEVIRAWIAIELE